MKGLAFAGLTWPGIVTWDDIRTVDYLRVARGRGPEAHRLPRHLDGRAPHALPRRVGRPHRGGVRRRVHVYRRPMIRCTSTRTRSSTSCRTCTVARHAGRRVDGRPAPLLVQQCEKDELFPLAGMKESLEVIAKVYEKAGVKDKFSGRFYNEPHKFTKEMQDDAFAFFDKHLEG